MLEHIKAILKEPSWINTKPITEQVLTSIEY